MAGGAGLILVGDVRSPVAAGEAKNVFFFFFLNQKCNWGQGNISEAQFRRHGGWVGVDNGCMKIAKLSHFSFIWPVCFCLGGQGGFDCHSPRWATWAVVGVKWLPIHFFYGKYELGRCFFHHPNQKPLDYKPGSSGECGAELPASGASFTGSLPPASPILRCSVCSLLSASVPQLLPKRFALDPYCSPKFLSGQVPYLISGSPQWEGEHDHPIKGSAGF